ncbi:hypothetical protein [Yinghuangia seranimata]|uniref:hypothetical protein n=1 Tax=Yinghuangia seranimata TaxID=408067 RepID=UPI00248CDE98|nr:hypothetical protein [Yinghuangia seranimata]MDI2130677.1 hypothetical protein [Yinghuangia seranimata]
MSDALYDDLDRRASCLIKIVLTGRQAPGSPQPEGDDLLPAAAAITTSIGHLYRQVDAFDPTSVTLGDARDAGDTGHFDTTGDTVTLWGTIRCAAEPDLPKLQRRLTVLAENMAQAYHCTATVDYPSGRTNPT